MITELLTTNPFLYQEPVTSSSFTNRHAELDDLTRRCANRVNVLLYGERRLGKSSLIQETLRRLPDGQTGLYVDIFRCASDAEAAEILLAAAGQTLLGRTQRAWTTLRDAVSHLRPQITLGAAGPSISLSPQPGGPPALAVALDALEALAIRKKTHLVVAIDEFQVLLDQGETDHLLRALRTAIQQQKNVSYIFSGSKKHSFLGLIATKEAPFWQQLDPIEVKGFDAHAFADAIKKHFTERGRAFPDVALDELQALCRSNPKRTQELLHHLYNEDTDVSPELVRAVANRVIAQQSHLLRQILDEVKPGNQRRVLKAFALEPGTKRITNAFLQQYALVNAQNVHRALDALRRHGILDDDNEFTDPFVRLHLLG